MKPLAHILIILIAVYFIVEDSIGEKKYLTNISRLIAGEETDFKPLLPPFLGFWTDLIILVVIMLVLNMISTKLMVGAMAILVISSFFMQYDRIPILRNILRMEGQ